MLDNEDNSQIEELSMKYLKRRERNNSLDKRKEPIPSTSNNNNNIKGKRE